MFVDIGREELKPLIDAFGVPVFVVDVEADGSFRYAAINAAHESMTGARNAAFAGRRPEDCLPAETASRVSQRYHNCVAAGAAIAYEEVLELPAGRSFWRTTLAPLMRDGRVVRLVGTAIEISDLRRAERAREETEQRLRDFLGVASDSLWEMDAELRFSFFSGTGAVLYATHLLGKTRWEAVGVDPDCCPRWARHRDDLLARRPFRDFDIAWVDAEGRRRHRRVSGAPILDRDGRFCGYRGVARDVTEEIEAARRVRENEQRLALALEGAEAGTFDIDLVTGIGIYSARAERMLGYAEGELNRHRQTWRTRVHPDDLPALESALRAHLRREQATYRAEFRQRCKDGSWRWMAAAGQVVERGPDGTPRRLLGIRFDIHERKQAQLRVEEMALTDPLTGLPNRLRFRQELERACARAKRSGMKVGLLLLDLDHFKDVNDAFGHSAGDGLLVEAAARLRTCVRSGDVVARLGGDEFAVITAEHPSPHAFTYLADRLVEALSKPFQVCGTPLSSGTSIGITIFPDDPGGVEQLMSNADVALYAAKGDGRRIWRLYDDSMQRSVERRRGLEHDLRIALGEGQFELHYQPVIDLETFAVTSVEALIRWNHPSRGRVGPDQFIPVAESTRLIVPLTEWVLHEAFMQSKLWQGEGLERLGVAVNISSRSLKTEGLVEYVVRSLASTDADPARMIIEVTETSLADEKRAIPVINALKALGVQVAVDDFGTGYSSLARLKLLPVDRLKIDRSFIAGASARKDIAIIESIVKLADSLGVRVVAEGIETLAQLRMVAGLGCREGQGFLLARPMPAAQVADWVRTWDGRGQSAALDLLKRRIETAATGEAGRTAAANS